MSIREGAMRRGLGRLNRCLKSAWRLAGSRGMGISDRDYMRREAAPPPDEPLDERLAARVATFIRNHPVLMIAAVSLLVLALALAACALFIPAS